MAPSELPTNPRREIGEEGMGGGGVSASRIGSKIEPRLRGRQGGRRAGGE